MQQIGYLLCDGFQMLALGTQTVFELANEVAGREFYVIGHYAVDGEIARSSLGMGVLAERAHGGRRLDTWIVLGVPDPLQCPPSPQLLRFVREQCSTAPRIAAICTGAFVLAGAGLLDGRRASTHWALAQHLQRLYPALQVEADRIHIVDGPVWTSAGMTAGFDLVLAMVEQDLGREVARGVARKLVMHQHRSGGQAQHAQRPQLAPQSERIQHVLDYARQHLARPLAVEELAQHARLSPRQFSRVFTAETGQSPARAIESLRLEAARRMIEQGQHPLQVIARETGFRDRRHLREAFVRSFGIPPRSLRHRMA